MLAPITVSFLSDNLKLTGSLFRQKTKAPGILFLHGAGKSNKDRYLPWGKHLAGHGYSVLAFDFRGCGTSQGTFADGSLNHRLADATAAYDYFVGSGAVDPTRICVAGSSMGGHVACRLTQKRPVKALILQYAAAYGAQTENLPLDESFTHAIRTPNSWQNSPAFTALNTFAGPICVVYGDHDAVIPNQIQLRYNEYAQRQGQYHVLPNAGHTLLNPTNETEQKNLQRLLEISTEFLDTSL